MRAKSGREEGGCSCGQRGGRAVMVAQAHKREGVGSHLQYLSVRASGSSPLGHLEDNSPSGHDNVSPLCHLLTGLVRE